MKKFLLTVALFGLLMFSLAIPVGASSTGWNQTCGGTENDGALSLVQTSDGGYAMAGYTRSFGAGEDDFWLVKTDEAGNIEWNRTYGGTGSDRWRIHDSWLHTLIWCWTRRFLVNQSRFVWKC